MPLFEYEATDPNGVSITAELSANDALEAVEKLRADGLTVSKIVQKAQASPNLFASLRETFDTQIDRPPDRPTTCGWCETRFPPPHFNA